LRVLINTIKNALEASKPNEVISAGCKQKNNEIEFWVHNPGFIPRNIQLQIFQRSFSTKGIGRGLGTYSMKFLTVRYLGGDVSFTSTEQEGTTFRIRLPFVLKVK
jgi:sensor histidine kinase regulating citrate/malate metabolism